MAKSTNWMKLVAWSKDFRPGAKQWMALPSTICFFVSANAVHASGANGLPPVVVHPVHTFTTPVHFSVPANGSGNQSSNNAIGNHSASNVIIDTTTQSTNNSNQTNH